MKLPDKFMGRPVEGAMKRLEDKEKKPEPEPEPVQKIETVVEKFEICGPPFDSWQATCNGVILRVGYELINITKAKCSNVYLRTVLYTDRYEEWKGGLEGAVIKIIKKKNWFSKEAEYVRLGLGSEMQIAKGTVKPQDWDTYDNGIIFEDTDESGHRLLKAVEGKMEKKRYAISFDKSIWRAGCKNTAIQYGNQISYGSEEGTVLYQGKCDKWEVGLGGIVVQNGNVLSAHFLDKHPNPKHVELYKGDFVTWDSECNGVAIQENDKLYWLKLK